MGATPSSSAQQGAYNDALGKYIPREYRNRFALYADDIAAGADAMEDPLQLFQMLIKCLDKSGIQAKA